MQSAEVRQRAVTQSNAGRCAFEKVHTGCRINLDPRVEELETKGPVQRQSQ